MRISDWSSDVCSSDLTAAYEAAIRANYGEFADAFLARYPAKTIEDSMLAATRDAMYGWTAERLVSDQAAPGQPASFYIFDHGYQAMEQSRLHSSHTSALNRDSVG